MATKNATPRDSRGAGACTGQPFGHCGACGGTPGGGLGGSGSASGSSAAGCSCGAQQAARDDEALDVGGAFVDLGDARVAQHPFGSGAAVDTRWPRIATAARAARLASRDAHDFAIAASMLQRTPWSRRIAARQVRNR
jgi:hypothetical protein